MIDLDVPYVPFRNPVLAWTLNLECTRKSPETISMESGRDWRKLGALQTAGHESGIRGNALFEQFKENLSLAREFTETVRNGLMSAQLAWRKATPAKKSIWLGVPSLIVASAVADHFSLPWYYLAALLVLAAIGSSMLGTKWRKLQ